MRPPLITAAKDVDKFSGQVGPVLVVKGKNSSNQTCMIARTLTNEQLIFLEENENIFRSPQIALEWIEILDVRDKKVSDIENRIQDMNSGPKLQSLA